MRQEELRASYKVRFEVRRREFLNNMSLRHRNQDTEENTHWWGGDNPSGEDSEWKEGEDMPLASQTNPGGVGSTQDLMEISDEGPAKTE